MTHISTFTIHAKHMINMSQCINNSHSHFYSWPYLREGSSDPLHVWFYGGVFGVGGSNDAISGLVKFNRYIGKTMREE